jgi:hypothetical protein
MAIELKTVANDESRFDLTGWMVLGLGVLITGLAVIVTLYRLTLPWDGWSFTRDATGSGQRLIFYEKLVAGASPLQRGDVLLAVQGQPFEEMLARALTFNPQRPPTWTEGRTSRYTVLRGGEQINLIVPLVRLTPQQVLSAIARSWLMDPSILPALLISLFVFLMRPRSPAARLLFILSACNFASNGISQAVTGSNILNVADLFYREAFWPGQFFSNLLWPFVIAPVYVRLFISFPVPKKTLVSRRRLTLLILYSFMPVLSLFAIATNPGEPLGFWRTWSAFSLLDFVLSLMIAILSAGHTLLTTHDATHRAQIRWVALGTIITSIGALSGGVLASLGVLGQDLMVDLFASRLLSLAFPLSIAIAVLRYRLFEIDVIIRRTIIYGVLTTILALLYFASIIVLQMAFENTTGHAQSELVTVISTLGIAALFVPLRRWVQNGIDKRFFRRKYDAARTLALFGARVSDQVDLERLSHELLVAVDETVQPEHISLWLRPANRRVNGSST